MLYSKEPKFTEHTSDGVVTSVALHLLAARLQPEHGHDHDPRGTAVLLSPNFALTARHVVTDTMAMFGIDGAEEKFTLLAVQVIEKGKVGVRQGRNSRRGSKFGVSQVRQPDRYADFTPSSER